MRIKENEIKEILEKFHDRDCKIETKGIFKEKIFFKNIKILFSENEIEFEIKDNNNYIKFDLSYIEEIELLEKNKLKFLTSGDLEILIIFL